MSDLDFGDPNQVRQLSDEEHADMAETRQKMGLNPSIRVPTIRHADYGTETRDFLKGAASILDVYQMLNIKGGEVQLSGRAENNMLRCPKPDHPDEEPSAWASTDTDTICCGTCGNEGFDALDLAAIAMGKTKASIRNEGPDFADVLVYLGEALGYEMVRRGNQVGYVMGGEVRGIEGDHDPADIVADQRALIEKYSKKETPQKPAPAIASSFDPLDPAAPSDDGGEIPAENVAVQLAEALQKNQRELPKPQLPEDHLWLRPGSFLDEWIKHCEDTIEVAPREYFLAAGLMAMSAVIGRETRLMDPGGRWPLNMSICLVGPTSVGKSRTLSAMYQLIGSVARWDHDDDDTLGVLISNKVSSGEALTKLMIREESKYPRPDGHESVSSIVEYDELKGLMARVKSRNSTLESTMMEFIDGKYEVGFSSLSQGGTNIARGAHVGFMTSTQPDTLSQLLNRADATSGFLNRWLWVQGDARRPDIDKPPSLSGGMSSEGMTKSVKLLGAIRGMYFNNGQGQELRFESQEVFDQAWRYRHTRLADLKGIYDDEQGQGGSMYGRLDMHLVKLMCMMAINDKATHISEIHFVRAKTLLEELVIPCYQRVEGEVLDDEIQKAREVIQSKLLERVKKTGKLQSQAELQSWTKQWRSNNRLYSEVFEMMRREGRFIEEIGTRTSRYAMKVAT